LKISGLKEFVYHELKKKLMNSNIKQGERIWEEEIAKEFGVSRTPVREAINRLIAEGFIENRPRKGIFAAEISKEELIKMLDIRIVLEELSVKMCCSQISEKEINEIKEIFSEYSLMLRNGDFGKASKLDSEIHKYIARVANSQKLSEYIDDIQDLFAYTRSGVVSWNQKKVERSIKDHHELIDAIAKRDEQKAMMMILKDIESMRELLGGYNDISRII
jgi:DNA-binding GntR family transcriptional regulator